MNRLFVMTILVFLLAACGQLEGDALTFKTADPKLTIGFRLQQPPSVTIEPQVLPEATATEAPLLPTVTPSGCVNAKGNISDTGEKIYHCPGQANYNNVKIDKDGEAIFATEQEAIDAGFRKALR